MDFVLQLMSENFQWAITGSFSFSNGVKVSETRVTDGQAGNLLIPVLIIIFLDSGEVDAFHVCFRKVSG